MCLQYKYEIKSKNYLEILSINLRKSFKTEYNVYCFRIKIQAVKLTHKFNE